MPSLPLKAQVAIRDHWTKSDGPLQTTLKSLQDLLGHEIALDPEWQILLAELDEFYPDKANFVQTIAGCVQTWAKSLTELLEDDSPGNEEWIETVLEKSKFGRLRIYLEVSSSSSEKGGTSWSEQRNGFIITIPKKRIFVPTELFPVFRGALLTCFETPKSKPLPLPLRQGAGGAAADEWADVKLDTTTGKPEVVEKQQTGGGAHGSLSRTAAVQFLPNVQSLPRPDELFLRPPYFLTVLPSHGGEIEIQGSHSPSLKFLADYLERWCRVNHHDTTAPPAIQIRLCQSAFGLGELYDKLILSTKETRYTNQFHITTTMVVALIEGVLGYDPILSQGTWSFRRDTEYKTL